MSIRLACVAVIAAASILVNASPSTAEPIQVVFDIQVVGRSTEPGGPTPFHARFPLTVTFDPEFLFFFEDCCQGAATYGHPTFGNVPLPHTGIPPGILPFDNHGSTGHWGIGEDGTFFRGISLNVDLSFDPAAGGLSGNHFTVSVSGFETGLTARPSLDAVSLLSAIRPTDFENFSFSTGRRAENGEFSGVSYVGFATYVPDDAPIPEPGTLLLVGTGVVAIWRRAFKQTGCSAR